MPNATPQMPSGQNDHQPPPVAQLTAVRTPAEAK
jgi:hypothetical protein